MSVVAEQRGAIDLHAHFLTPTYRAACEAAGITAPDGFPHLPDWSPATALDLMDKAGIEAAVLSISSPGILLGSPAEAVELATTVNGEAARIVEQQRDRFGFAASLPIPDVAASIAEVGRAYDELGADAVSLLTNYGGLYLGDPVLEPLMAELDRRGSVVLLHPTSPACWQEVAFGRPRPMVEFILDTTRTVMNLALAGVLTRHRGIRWVIPHCGGATSVLADRVHVFAPFFAGEGEESVDVLAELGRLYYDVAGVALPRALPAIERLVGAGRLVYGSDFPFTPEASVLGAREALAEDAFVRREVPGLFRDTALSLFPRFG